jgi:hypothetical protein
MFNAVEHGGMAEVGAVMSKVFCDFSRFGFCRRASLSTFILALK